MTVWGVFATFVAAMRCVLCGWFCLFRTETIAGWLRANCNKRRLVRAYPFSSLVLKPWYPTYLRCMGVFIWLFAVVFVSVLILTGVHH